LIPHCHIPTWFDANAEERAALFKALDAAKAIIEQNHRPDGYNIGINCGPSIGYFSSVP